MRMEIIVHRGTNQIGGCSTEIRTVQTRILIDFGSELPDAKGNNGKDCLRIDGVTHGDKPFYAVFFTHYHSDHTGMLDDILPGIPLYMGKASKEILMELYKKQGKPYLRIKKACPYTARKRIKIGDIAITPYFVDHSAYDAYMFLVEAEGRKVLHMGDFRDAGFLGKGLIPTLEKYVGQVDVLITEATTLSRGNIKIMTEKDLQCKAKELLLRYKYVFVLCSSTNIDRLAAFHNATPRGKYVLCDSYQKHIFKIVEKYAGKHCLLYSFAKALTYYNNIKEKVINRGFCMFVRSNHSFSKIIHYYIKNYPNDCLLVYSMWDGYIKQLQSELKSFIEECPHIAYLHTSGHASPQTIENICHIVAPKEAVIPIHSDNPSEMFKMNLPYHIKALTDGEVYQL